MTLGQRDTLGWQHPHPVGFGRCVPDRQDPLERLTRHNPIVVDQHIEYDTAEIAGGCVEVSQLIVDLDTSGVKALLVYCIGLSTPYDRVLEITSGTSQ
jgi:hypothetical protein